jgi:hypothetical protein
MHPWVLQDNPPSFVRHIAMDFVWTCVNFATVVLPYRLITAPELGLWDALRKTALSGSFFFFLLTAVVLFRYPDSLADRVWVAARGILAGIFVMLMMTIGMLMR